MTGQFIRGAAAAMTLPAILLAQTPALPQIEQARQAKAPPDAVDLQGQRNAPQSESYEDSGISDDAFGSQALLKRQEKPQPFTGYAGLEAFATNNVALVKKQPQQDGFLVATTAAAFTQHFSYNIRFDASVRAAAYRYSKFTALDFQDTEVSAGLAWSPTLLRGAEVFTRYTFTDLTTAAHTREFYTNHGILAGIQRSVPITRAQAVYGGVSALWSFANPQPATRDEYGVFAGYHVQLTRHIDSDLFYRYARYVYRLDNGRQDNNHTLSLAVHYSPVEWATLSATGMLGFNRSNQEVFSYNVADAGAGVQLSIRF